MCHDQRHDSGQIAVRLGESAEQHDHGDTVILNTRFYGNRDGVGSRLTEDSGHEKSKAEAAPGQEKCCRYYERVTDHHAVDVGIYVQAKR
jgi:hypothetical protein